MAMKKLSAALLAVMLTVPCTIPSICLADTKIPAEAARTEDDALSDDQTEKSEGLKVSIKSYTKEYKTEQGKVYKELSYEYPQAEGDSEAAQAFNKFYKNLRTKWIRQAQENLKDAEEAVSQSDSGSHYADEVTCEIANNDKDYICVFQSGYNYEMGAHGMPYRYTYIFDAKTGKKVSAAQILGISKTQLNKKVRSLYLKKFDKTQKDEDALFYPNKDQVEEALSELNFNNNCYYLKNGKMWFYADPYAVGPYASGFIEVSVKL